MLASPTELANFVGRTTSHNINSPLRACHLMKLCTIFHRVPVRVYNWMIGSGRLVSVARPNPLGPRETTGQQKMDGRVAKRSGSESSEDEVQGSSKRQKRQHTPISTPQQEWSPKEDGKVLSCYTVCTASYATPACLDELLLYL